MREQRFVIRAARVVDGTGAPWFVGDVEVAGDRIARVGRCLDVPRGTREIRADGRVVAPGFIDIHSHSDDTILLNPRAESKVRQGVTCEVVGNCGYSLAPLEGEALADVRRDLGEAGLDLSWRSFGEYLRAIEKCGTAVNVASLVGHGTIRRAVMGCVDRAPSREEMERMKSLLSGALAEGAWGLSTGLIYPPSCYASMDELVELAQVSASAGGMYASHIRYEEDRVVEAVEEAIAIGERARVPVQVSHHKAGGVQNWGKVRMTIELMSKARARGVDVACDVYPYTASSTGLAVILPQWIFDGGLEAAMARLKDTAVREGIRRQVEEEEGAKRGWDKTVIASCTRDRNKRFEGKNLVEIAEMTGKDPFTAALDLIVDESAAVQTVRFGMCEEDVEYVLAWPASSIGSDASVRAPYGPLGKGKPHPRSYGTFPRVLARYVRERGVLTLEEAVRKMTSLPAQRLGILDRGIIRPGMVADLVVFDPDKVADTATYDDPHRYPTGIDWVFVAGTPVIERGEHTGATPGRVLRHRHEHGHAA
ncbi:MAG: D-aminoacylase [Bacillota bacterium]|nr:D-aminoacylase [Bacillota bacterium]